MILARYSIRLEVARCSRGVLQVATNITCGFADQGTRIECTWTVMDGTTRRKTGVNMTVAMLEDFLAGDVAVPTPGPVTGFGYVATPTPEAVR